MQLKPLAAIFLSSLMGAALAASPVAEGDLPGKAVASQPVAAAAPKAASLSATADKVMASAVAPQAKAVPAPAVKAEPVASPASFTAERVKPATDKGVAEPAKPSKDAKAVATDKAAPSSTFMPVLEEGAVNPFTGESLSAERRKREAERIRAENAVLEERIKQVSLLNDLNHAPVRKRVEMEQFLESNKPKMVAVPVTKNGAAPVVETTQPAKVPSTSGAPKKSAKPVKAPAKVEAPALVAQPVKQVAPAAPVYVQPEVVGVIRTKDGSTAILNNNGKTILARPGETSSAGVVTAVSEKQVQLGNQTLEFYPSAVARIQRTDKETKKEEPTATVQVPSRPQVSLPPIPGTGSSSLPPSVRPPATAAQAPTAPVSP